MEQQNNPSNTNANNNNNSNNKLLYIIIAILAVLLITVLSYILFFKDKNTNVTTKSKQDSLITSKVPDSIKIDTATVAKKGKNEYDEEEYYEPYTESYIIANEAFLRSSPNLDASSKVKSLHFGDKLYVKDFYNTNGDFYKAYLTKPANEDNPTETAYYISNSTVVEGYAFDEFKESFSLEPFSGLDSKVKKLILDEDYYDGTKYSVSQNSDRAKTAVCFADFDQDGIKDVAVALDNNEKQQSRLLIICHNKASKEPYLAYADNYTEKIKINSFKKGARMFMDTEELVSSPIDGVIIKSEESKIAVIYDADNLKFKSFSQE